MSKSGISETKIHSLIKFKKIPDIFLLNTYKRNVSVIINTAECKMLEMIYQVPFYVELKSDSLKQIVAPINCTLK